MDSAARSNRKESCEAELEDTVECSETGGSWCRPRAAWKTWGV